MTSDTEVSFITITHVTTCTKYSSKNNALWEGQCIFSVMVMSILHIHDFCQFFYHMFLLKSMKTFTYQGIQYLKSSIVQPV